jgi:hypothetical protein
VNIPKVKTRIMGYDGTNTWDLLMPVVQPGVCLSTSAFAMRRVKDVWLMLDDNGNITMQTIIVGPHA